MGYTREGEKDSLRYCIWGWNDVLFAMHAHSSLRRSDSAKGIGQSEMIRCRSTFHLPIAMFAAPELPGIPQADGRGLKECP